jgi:hypothetical protein
VARLGEEEDDEEGGEGDEEGVGGSPLAGAAIAVAAT